jgi:NAD(P)-dependent dehydrogenase (short-subunit alcohol dehydrogenase family)
MDLGVRGRLYVLIGGSRGMGWECARLLAAEGARIAIVCRNPEAIADEAAELERMHGTQVKAFAADVAQPGSVEAALDQIVAQSGAPRGLALTNHWMNSNAVIGDVSDNDWDQLYQNSLMAAVRTCREVIPLMAQNGGGSIVITSAYSSRAPKPKLVAYATFKAALNTLTKALAKTCGPDGIRVNCVAPGAIKTGRYKARMAALMKQRPDLTPSEADRRILAGVEMNVALGRYGEPAEVADMIVFLLSERSGYTTGLIANIDGGTDF